MTIPIKRAPRRARETYPLRLAKPERQLLEAAAAQRGEYLSEYLRRAGIAAARRDLALEATAGATTPS